MEQLCEGNSILGQLVNERLIWIPEAGIGWYPVKTAPYNKAYFDQYAAQAKTDIGRALMRARVEFVARHYKGELCDIGIGSGAFIETRWRAGQPTLGFDINPAGIDWLDERVLFADPYLRPQEAITCWDVLEHIHDFQSLLRQTHQFVFVSIPVFKDMVHVMRSKHFKPMEHCWYFTKAGLIRIFLWCGFELVEANTIETQIGREDIGSFAFKRVRTAP